MKQLWCLVLLLVTWTTAYGWEEQWVLDFATAHNPILRAQRVVTEEYTPPNGVMARMKEYTSIYGRAGTGGTDYLGSEDEPLVLQVGVQMNIPLATTKERRERAM